MLVLRETSLERISVPWARVRLIDLSTADPGEARRQAERAEFTRLPVVRREGDLERVVGYVHQLEVLASDRPLEELLRPLPHLSPGTPVDRALRRLRDEGQALALVGTPERPLGLVTLTDLLGEIARESGPGESAALSELGRNSPAPLG